MSTITLLRREVAKTISYPVGFPGSAAHAKAGCPGCAGVKGSCPEAQPVELVRIEYALDGGPMQRVTVPLGAADADIKAAIRSTLPADDPLMGSTL